MKSQLLLKATFFSAIFCFGMVQADSATPKTAKAVIFTEEADLNYDGPVQSRWFPWLFSIRRYPSYTGAVLAGLPTNVRCGAVTLNYNKPYHGEFGMPEADNYNCAMSVIALDFTKREVVALMDLYKSENGQQKVQLRHMIRISGKPTEFFAPLLETPVESTKKLTTLNELITRFSKLNTVYTQKRHLNGSLVMQPVGEMLWDPLNSGLTPPTTVGGWLSIPLSNGGRLAISLDRSSTTYEMKSSTNEATYLSAKPLFEELPKTLEILKNGYEALKTESDDENQAIFRNQIKDHAGEIRKELKTVMKTMREKPIHPMEMIWFMSEVSGLVAAIDAILLDQYGTNPGFVEILKQSN